MKDFLKIVISMLPLFVVILVPEVKESIPASLILISLFFGLICFWSMREMFMAAVGFVIDPKSRAVSRHKYPNGAGMSIREAEGRGLHE